MRKSADYREPPTPDVRPIVNWVKNRRRESWEKTVQNESRAVSRNNGGDIYISRTKKYQRYWKIIKQYVEFQANHRILDIGCREYGFVDFLNNGIRYGLDPVIDVRNEYHQNSGVYSIKGIGESLPFQEGSFDILIMTNILDHVYQPLKVLEESLRILKKDGILIIAIHVFSVTNLFKLLRVMIGMKRDRFHMHTFTRKSVEKLVTGIDLTLLASESIPLDNVRRSKLKMCLYNRLLIHLDHILDSRICASSEDILLICRK
jgi:SAM-dependent methyltransferase